MPPTANGLDAVWTAQRKWSAVANSAGRHLQVWRWRNLVLLVSGALLGALAAQAWIPDDVGSWLAGAGAVVLVTAVWVQQTRLGPDRVARQTVARSASEALKAVAYWYLAGVAPYAEGDRDAVLGRALRSVDDDAADHHSAYTLADDDGRAPPAFTGVAGYVTARAEDQRDWHRGRIVTYEKKAARFRHAESVATLAAAVLAAVAALFPFELEAWIGLATTVGATLAAHLLATRYDRLAASYGRTTTHLTRLIDERAAGTPSAESDADFVRSVEEVLAVQNEGWVALLSS